MRLTESGPALRRLRDCLPPIAAGMAHSLAFAPDPLPSWALPFTQLLAMCALVVLVWRARSVRQAATLGLLFGMGHFTTGLYWLHTSMHVYAGLPWFAAAGGVLALALFLSLFHAAACGLSRWLAPHHAPQAQAVASPLACCLAWASSWTLFEWLRGTLFTGFPWLNIGYAHADSVLAGLAPLAGVYGIAWFAAFAAATLAMLAVTAPGRAGRGRQADAAGNGQPPLTWPVLAIALGGAATAMLAAAVPWSQPHGSPLMVRLVQGNIPQSDKFDPALLIQGMTHYRDLAAVPPKEGGRPPDLVVLPETVIPVPQDLLPESEWALWRDVARQHSATLLLGIPLYHDFGGREGYTNSVIAFDANTPLQALRSGLISMRYHKHHLVPFGEFVPPGFRWFVNAMNIPLGDFDRGGLRQRLFPIAGQTVAPNICYEDVFGEEILHAVRDSAIHGPGASLLVNLSNLAWFGDSWALRQHLQMSRMRSMETRRPMLRATNTGTTAAIDPDGRVRAVLPAQQVGILDVEVQGTTGMTAYVRSGNLPILLASGLLLALLLAARKARATRAQAGAAS